MKLENEDALDNYIICHQCSTLHEEVPIKDGSKACCSECGGLLYSHDSRLASHGLALSITGLIFFILANCFKNFLHKYLKGQVIIIKLAKTKRQNLNLIKSKIIIKFRKIRK